MSTKDILTAALAVLSEQVEKVQMHHATQAGKPDYPGRDVALAITKGEEAIHRLKDALDKIF